MTRHSSAFQRIAPLISFLILSTSSVLAWTARLHQPPPNQLYIEHLWALDVTNEDPAPVDARLHGWIVEAELGRVYEGTSNEITLQPGVNRITSRQITDVSQVYRHPDFRDVLRRTGRFPAGHYTEVCVEVLRASNGQSLATSCIEQRVVILSPIKLIAPPNESQVKDKLPFFQWTAASGAESYGLVLSEILDGQTKDDALVSNRPWFETRDQRGLSLRYPLTARRLEVGKRYAWRVFAYVGSHAFTWSPVYVFIFGESERLLTREEAIQILLKRVIVPATLEGDLLAFLGREPLDEGDTVFQDVELQVVFAPEGPTWFAWLYDEPAMEFEHPTRYVFVDAVTGEYEVHRQDWWPLLNRELIWNTREEMTGDRYIFFRNPAE
jgi:hypothetical protein